AGAWVAVRPDTPDDPDALSRWAPGVYTAGLLVRRADTPTLASNELAISLAPRITVSPATPPAGTVTLTITCAPRLVERQRVLLIVGDRQVAPDTITTPGDPAQP